MHRLRHLALLACLLAPLFGCSDAKQRDESTAHLQGFGEAITAYYGEHQKWPATLADVKPMIGTDLGGMKVGGGKSYDELLKNPLTGDNPGYEYVRPPEPLESTRNVIALYQLRGGKRDESLKVGYLDGSVRMVGDDSP
jgi:hypothetical protein